MRPRCTLLRRDALASAIMRNASCALASALCAAALLVTGGCGDDSGATSGTDSGASTTATTTTTTATTTTTTTATTAAETTETATEASGTDSDSESDTGGPIACDPRLGLLSERGLLLQGPPVDAQLQPCGADRWYLVGASESELQLTIRGQDAPIEVILAYPDLLAADAWKAPLTPVLSVAAGEQLDHSFAVPRSGEFALYVRPQAPDPQSAPAYQLELSCQRGCERETTRFPLLWVHGWTGFESIGPLNYWYGVRAHVEPYGYPFAVAVLDPYNSSEVRGAQLAEQIDGFLLEWRARRLDLIGHSQGGIDSRYAITTLGYGDRVDALLTIASPHRGTYITDLALGLAPGAVEEALAFLLNLLGAVSAQSKSDAKASFYSLSEHYMQGEFNPQNPDDPRVHYTSYTGRSCAAIDFLSPANECVDYIDPLLLWAYNILKIARGPNDGLVTVESAIWGEYRGEMIADHIDEVGQIAGVTDPNFDHRAWYLDRVRELAADGH